MKYKTKPIEGTKACPEWLAEAMVKGEAIKCLDLDGEPVDIVGWTGYSYMDSEGCDFNVDDVTPITAWEPQEGEVVLAWSNKDISAFPMIFNEISENRIWGKLTCTDDQVGQIGFWDSDNITPFSIELYIKPISEWPKDIEIIHVENIKEEAKENTW